MQQASSRIDTSRMRKNGVVLDTFQNLKDNSTKLKDNIDADNSKSNLFDVHAQTGKDSNLNYKNRLNKVIPFNESKINKIRKDTENTLSRSEINVPGKSTSNKVLKSNDKFNGKQIKLDFTEKLPMTYLQKVILADMGSIFFAISGLIYEMYLVASYY